MTHAQAPSLRDGGDGGDPMLGRVVGSYRIARRLGDGPDRLYLAIHEVSPDTRVVVEVAPLSRRELAERFERQVSAAAAVGVYRVVRPLELGLFDDGQAFVVHEHVDGWSLSTEVRQRGALPLGRALAIAATIADTLAQAHERGFAHGTLAPRQVLVSGMGEDLTVKLRDLGSLRAPLRAGRVDGSDDVLALGALLYRMLAGEQPLPPSTAQGERVPSVAERRPSSREPVPPRIVELVDRMLAREAAARPPTSEVACVIAEVLGWRAPATETPTAESAETVTAEVAPAPAPPVPADTPAPPYLPSRRALWIIAIAALVGAAIALAAFYAARR